MEQFQTILSSREWNLSIACYVHSSSTLGQFSHGPFCIAYQIKHLESILKELTNLVSTDVHLYFISTLIQIGKRLPINSRCILFECAHTCPSRAECQFMDLWLKEPPVNSSYIVGQIKVSAIPRGNLERLDPVRPLIQKIILRLQICTNTITIRSELQATFKEEINI